MSAPSRVARIARGAGLVALAAFAMGQQCAPAPTSPAGVSTLAATANADADGDGVPDYLDNCRSEPNASQRESARHDVTCEGEVQVTVWEDGEEITEIAFGSCSNDPGVACLADRDCLRGNACDCDFDGDGHCNIDDYNAFLADYGGAESSGAGTDMDGDGVVDDQDFSLFEPLFSAGAPGPGATHERVVDVNNDGDFVPGGCWDRRQARRIQGSEGRSDGVDILDCTVPLDSPTLGVLQLEAMQEDKNNPTDKYVELLTGDPDRCPNAAFSISSKTDPRACDNHDLCISACGTTNADCNTQFARDLFNTCEALAGAERDSCYTPCIEYAIAYATDVNGFLILSPPREPNLSAPSQADYESDLNDCQCGAPVCERNADCLDTFADQRISVCRQGYCVHLFSRECTSDAECGDGYRCEIDLGDDPVDPNDDESFCVWDVRSHPDRRGTPPPICGDGTCEGPAETCTASSCPEDCGDTTRALIPEFGRCELGDRCQLDRDCTEGACLHGECQRLAVGSACAEPSYCESGACSAVGRSCIDSCTFDSECETGVCSILGQCIDPLADGFPCDANGDCASGVCNFPICIAANSVSPGSLCTTDGACTSGDCVAGVCAGSCGDGFCTELPDLETCFVEGCQADCGKCPTATPGCDEDADCAGDLCRAGVCLERASLDPGHVCLFDEECASGTCTGGFCAGSCGDGFCTAVPNLEGCLTCGTDCGKCANGTPGCIVNSQCASGNCSGGFCGGAPNGTLCVANGVCASGVCNNAVCVNPDSVALGGICTTSLACDSGTCLTGICVCDSNSDCPSGRSCVANVCITVPTCTSNGGGCVINSTCCSGRCDGVPPECRAKLGNGSSCNENSDCSSGDCSFFGECQ